MIEISRSHPFEIPIPGPVDVAGPVELFCRHGDDLIDRWDGAHLVRTVPMEGGTVAYACAVAGTLDEPVVQVAVEDEQHRDAVEPALSSMFVLPPPQFSRLLVEDPIVATLNALFPGIRPVLQHDLLSALVRCISAQQVFTRCSQLRRSGEGSCLPVTLIGAARLG